MQSVRQFDDNHPDILRHGQKHLPEVLRLHLQLFIRLVSPCRQGNLLQLRDSVHQQSHIISEFLLQILLCHNGILHHIMENTSHYGFLVQLQIGQNNGYVQRMNDIRFSGLTELIFMRLLSSLICLLNHGDIVAGMIFPHTGNKLPI